MELNYRFRHDADNGVLFEGTQGRIFVNRGKLVGQASRRSEFQSSARRSIGEDLQKSRADQSRENFFDSVVSRKDPISILTVTIVLFLRVIGSIAARIGRTIRWDPSTESVISDPLAQSLVGRENRRRFDIEM